MESSDEDDLPLSKHKSDFNCDHVSQTYANKKLSDLRVYNHQKCEFCEYEATTKYDILVHNTTHIIIPLLNLHECNKCSCYFESLKLLQSHMVKEHIIDISGFINKVPKLILKDINQEIIKDFDDFNKIEEKSQLDLTTKIPQLILKDFNQEIIRDFSDLNRIEGADERLKVKGNGNIQGHNNDVKKGSDTILQNKNDITLIFDHNFNDNTSELISNTSRTINESKKDKTTTISKQIKEKSHVNMGENGLKSNLNGKNNTLKTKKDDSKSVNDKFKLKDKFNLKAVPTKKRILFEDDVDVIEVIKTNLKNSNSNKNQNLINKTRNVNNNKVISNSTCHINKSSTPLNNTITHYNVSKITNNNNSIQNVINNTIDNLIINTNNHNIINETNNRDVLNSTIKHINFTNHHRIIYNPIPNYSTVNTYGNGILQTVLPIDMPFAMANSNSEEEFILPDVNVSNRITNSLTITENNASKNNLSIPATQTKTDLVNKNKNVKSDVNSIDISKKHVNKVEDNQLNKELKTAVEEMKTMSSNCDEISIFHSVHYDELARQNLIACHRCKKVFPNRLSCLQHETIHMKLKVEIPKSYYKYEHTKHKCSKHYKICSKSPNKRHLVKKRCDFCRKSYKIWSDHFKKHHAKGGSQPLLLSNEDRLKNITKRLKLIKLGRL